MKRYIVILSLILIRGYAALAQQFVNLDFENANLSGYSAGSVPAIDAIPGWTAYLDGTPLVNINYDTSPLSGIDIFGGSSLQGNYYITLSGTLSQPASIGQTGTVPITAQSLTWWGAGPDVLSFNGQTLPFKIIGGTAQYNIYAADISAFAGQTGQLLFTSDRLPTADSDIIDNIQFSPVPEPSSAFLLLLGSGVLMYVRRPRFTPTPSLA